MLFMIDTCQANTLYKHFYSPNIIATGSSEIDESSYSHHADNDVGVAVIDRWTYYILDFLETQVTTPTSKLTLANLFDSYDESKIHSRPGVRWDLFEGGEQKGRERLVMDFFGNVQAVELDGGKGGGANESEWREDIRRLEEFIQRARDWKNKTSTPIDEDANPQSQDVRAAKATGEERFEAAAKVEAGDNWTQQQLLGTAALIGSIVIWGAASWLESK